MCSSQCLPSTAMAECSSLEGLCGNNIFSEFSYVLYFTKIMICYFYWSLAIVSQFSLDSTYVIVLYRKKDRTIPIVLL